VHESTKKDLVDILYKQMGPDIWYPDKDEAKKIAKFIVYVTIVINSAFLLLAMIANARNWHSSLARTHLMLSVVAFCMIYYVEHLQLYVIEQYDVYSYIVIIALIVGVISTIAAHSVLGRVVIQRLFPEQRKLLRHLL